MERAITPCYDSPHGILMNEPTPIVNQPNQTVESRAVRSAIPSLLIGGLIFGGLAVVLHSQQEEMPSTGAAAAQLDETGKIRPLAEVIETTRALKLVTVTVDTSVLAEVKDEGWRGRASASVKAPVRYVYGVDLSELRPDAFRLGRILGIYEITIPQPARIAVEVDGSHPIEEVVEVTGLRFRKISGEYYQGLARKAIYDQARKSALPKETMDDIYARTREQVEDLVRRFVGPTAQVRVRYKD